MARVFDGGATTDIELPTVAHNIGGGPFTWAFWIYATTKDTWNCFYQNGDSSNTPGLFFAMSGGNWGAWWTSQRNSGNSLVIDKLYHLVMRRNSADLVEFFQNGEKTPTSYTISTTMNGAIQRYGQNGQGSSYFDGEQLEGATWTIDLTDAEIKALYQQAKTPLQTRRTHLITNHDLARPGFDREIDLSGHGYDGTYTNDPAFSTRVLPKKVKRSLVQIFATIESGGAALVKITNDTINISEAKNHLLSLIRFGNDTVNIAEAQNRLKVIGAKVINDTVNISEAQNKALGFIKVISDTLNISEAQNHILSVIKVINETLNISESKNRLLSLVRFGNDIINISEVNNRTLALVRIINNTLNISETVNHLKVIGAKVINDTLNISEVQNKALGVIKVISDTINISEAQNKVAGVVKVINNTINISESTNRLLGLVRTISDIINISETNNRLRTLIRIISDTINILEGIIRKLPVVSAVGTSIDSIIFERGADSIVLNRGADSVIISKS